jgi:conserved oligomeric Golgi complex subunit 5
LEKVLKLKKDPISQVVFLDEAMKVKSITLLRRHGANVVQVLESKPSTTFWAALGRSLEKQTREATKSKNVS